MTASHARLTIAIAIFAAAAILALPASMSRAPTADGGAANSNAYAIDSYEVQLGASLRLSPDPLGL